MAKEFQLYGARWQKGRRGELPRQIYDAFVKEIVSGRWSVGERLPTYEQLRRDTGASRTSIETALNRLDETGFITRESKKGMFLKTLHPGRHAQTGTVAVITGTPGARNGTEMVRRTESFGLFDIDTIRGEAREIGLNAVPVSVNSDAVEITARLDELCAEPDFHGIISMVSKKRMKHVDTRLAPIVYLGVADLNCAPAVVGSPYRAMCLLTEHLVTAGHHKIGVFMPPNWACEVSDLMLRGHRQAMAEAGLVCQEEPIALSSAIEHLDVAAVKGVLGACSDCTAFIGGSIEVTRKIAETADLLEIAIPDQLSICSMQAGVLREGRKDPVLGISYDWHTVITTCFELLLSEEKRRHLSRLVISPEIIDSASLSVRQVQ